MCGDLSHTPERQAQGSFVTASLVSCGAAGQGGGPFSCVDSYEFAGPRGFLGRKDPAAQ